MDSAAQATNGSDPGLNRVVLSCRHVPPMIACYHDVMPRNLTVRLDEELASDTEALARADGTSLNETVKVALREAVERRRNDPEFKARLRRIVEQDRELLQRLAR
jgi:hypothetical protein